MKKKSIPGWLCKRSAGDIHRWNWRWYSHCLEDRWTVPDSPSSDRTLSRWRSGSCTCSPQRYWPPTWTVGRGRWTRIPERTAGNRSTWDGRRVTPGCPDWRPGDSALLIHTHARSWITLQKYLSEDVKPEAFCNRKPPPRQLIPQNSYNCPNPVVLEILLKNSWIRIVIRIITKIERFVARYHSRRKVSLEFVNNFL